MVLGGLLKMSRQMRLTPLTWLIIPVDSRPMRSYGNPTQSGVMPSTLPTARMAMGNTTVGPAYSRVWASWKPSNSFGLNEGNDPLGLEPGFCSSMPSGVNRGSGVNCMVVNNLHG